MLVLADPRIGHRLVAIIYYRRPLRVA
jgi:hypothetical protein